MLSEMRESNPRLRFVGPRPSHWTNLRICAPGPYRADTSDFSGQRADHLRHRGKLTGLVGPPQSRLFGCQGAAEGRPPLSGISGSNAAGRLQRPASSPEDPDLFGRGSAGTRTPFRSLKRRGFTVKVSDPLRAAGRARTDSSRFKRSEPCPVGRQRRMPSEPRVFSPFCCSSCPVEESNLTARRQAVYSGHGAPARVRGPECKKGRLGFPGQPRLGPVLVLVTRVAAPFAFRSWTRGNMRPGL